jgi:hypothetical protein
VSTTFQKAKSFSRFPKKAKSYSRLPKKQKCSHSPRNPAVSIYSHKRKKGTPITRGRDGPGSQKSPDLAAFSALPYVFLVIKTTVSTWHEETFLLIHTRACSQKCGQEHIHDFACSHFWHREHIHVLPVRKEHIHRF